MLKYPIAYKSEVENINVVADKDGDTYIFEVAFPNGDKSTLRYTEGDFEKSTDTEDIQDYESDVMITLWKLEALAGL